MKHLKNAKFNINKHKSFLYIKLKQKTYNNLHNYCTQQNNHNNKIKNTANNKILTVDILTNLKENENAKKCYKQNKTNYEIKIEIFVDGVRKTLDIYNTYNNTVEHNFKINNIDNEKTVEFSSNNITNVPIFDNEKEIPTPLFVNISQENIPTPLSANVVQATIPTQLSANVVQENIPTQLSANVVQENITTKKIIIRMS
jgi:hypothetical protein